MEAPHVRRLPQRAVSELRSSFIITDSCQAVDETVANAIDAGASAIEISLDLDHYSFVVRDNGHIEVSVESYGHGISSKWVSQIAKRYHTSKLHSLHGLNEVASRSYGFRGEFLASMSQVALLEIVTRSKDSPKTWTLGIRGSETLWCKESRIARHVGTAVTVRDLFYSLPVRRRTLDGRKDTARCLRRLQRLALVHPSVQFAVYDTSRDAVIMQTRRVQTIRDSFAQLFDRPLAAGLHKLRHQEGAFELRGYISRIEHAHVSKDFQFLYVAGRPVDYPRLHKLLSTFFKRCYKWVVQGGQSQYEAAKTVGRAGSDKWATAAPNKHPVYILDVAVDASQYDVLFGPDKTAVEFQDHLALLRCVEGALRTFIAKTHPVLSTIDEIWRDFRPRYSASRLPAESFLQRRDEPTEDACATSSGVRTSSSSGTTSDHNGPPTKRRRKMTATPSFAVELECFRSPSRPSTRTPAPADRSRTMTTTSSTACVDFAVPMSLPMPSAKAKTATRPVEDFVQQWVDRHQTMQPRVASTKHINALRKGATGMQVAVRQPNKISRDMLSRLRVLSQVDNKFIAACVDGTLVLIDQHAADERVRLERMHLSLFGLTRAERNFGTKSLCPPVCLQVTSQDMHTLQLHSDTVGAWGFRVTPCTGTELDLTRDREILLHSVPVFEGTALTGQDLKEYLSIIGSAAIVSRTKPPAVDRVLNSAACRGAIMFGDPLSATAQSTLVADLTRCNFPFNCAHGRPTMVPLLQLSKHKTGGVDAYRQFRQQLTAALCSVEPTAERV